MQFVLEFKISYRDCGGLALGAHDDDEDDAIRDEDDSTSHSQPYPMPGVIMKIS